MARRTRARRPAKAGQVEQLKKLAGTHQATHHYVASWRYSYFSEWARRKGFRRSVFDGRAFRNASGNVLTWIHAAADIPKGTKADGLVLVVPTFHTEAEQLEINLTRIEAICTRARAAGLKISKSDFTGIGKATR